MLRSAFTKADSTREHELFQYFQPPSRANATISKDARQNLECLNENTLSADVASSPDTILTALAQLCALRLDASRAMISVIDKEHQYFVAEATKSLNLTDGQESDVEGDGLWVGCSTVEKHGRLCEKTIELAPTPGKYPCFTVTDLTQDMRFCQLPFVTDAPFFKFYAGTPLTTRNNVNIGSLFILDNRVRPQLSASQEDFLGTIAKTVMKHMEVTSEAEERKRAMRMSRGLNAFVEGKSRFDLEDRALDISALDTRRRGRHREAHLRKVRSSNSHEAPPQTSADAEQSDHSTPSETADDSEVDSEAGVAQVNAESGHTSTFVRAANLLRESLDLRGTGGVVFLDTSIGFRGRLERSSDYSAASDDPTAESNTDRSGTASKPFKHSTDLAEGAVYSHSIFAGPYGEQTNRKPADVISLSTSEDNSNSMLKVADMESFSPLNEELLHSFLQRYPRGKLWSFDEVGSLSSSEEEITSPRERGKPSGARDSHTKVKKHEARMLQRYFPNVRQLLFAPLWDAGSARWFSGCFCWGTSDHQIFSAEVELNFLLAFGSSIMAEVSRRSSIFADRQKGDFIGSISHELRSPLHGIMASAELLVMPEEGTHPLNAHQQSLVSTVRSCGVTLLDTINHILDFSKINSFERNWHNVRKPRVGARNDSNTSSGRAVKKRMTRKEGPPLMNIYAITDIAAITEEVIEGVYAGQAYQDITSADFNEMSSGARGRNSERDLATANRSIMIGSGGEQHRTKEIEVVLDIAQGDYVFTTQPGALRRVIMNVLGNALKYTQKGMIVVKLALDEPDGTVRVQATNDRLLNITITDTGKGISAEYLRTSLYTPFCQEDTLASGTGLGLSIVRSIITMLGGSIDIRSQVGQGTEVEMHVPLRRVPGSDTPGSTPSSSNSIEHLYDDSISALQIEHPGKSVALYGFDPNTSVLLQGTNTAQVLREYVEHWFGLNFLPKWSVSTSANIIIVDERDFPALSEENICGSPVIVLSSNYSRVKKQPTHNIGVVEHVCKPFGPYKLARAMRLCLDRARSAASSLNQATTREDVESSRSSDADTIIPEFEELTIDADDAPITVQSNGVVTARDSTNAQMAVDNSSAGAASDYQSKIERGDFPFPSPDQNQSETKTERLRLDMIRRDSRRPKLNSRVTEPSLGKMPFPITTVPVTEAGEMITTIITEPSPETDVLSTTPANVEESRPTADPTIPASTNGKKGPPSLLLVDDNKINLTLLERFVCKRKYKFYDCASNGQEAVDAAEANKEGYDVIFMGKQTTTRLVPGPPNLNPSLKPLTSENPLPDISMPVMNGFEATRAIREVERKRGREYRSATAGNQTVPALAPPALIIAITGLASSRDQSEAFTSGVDLFCVKPVTFAEVGRLLDNWEAHNGSRREDWGRVMG